MITKFHLSIAMLAVSVSGCQAMATNNSVTAPDGIRHVNQVTWDKTGDSFKAFNDELLADDQSRLVFIRQGNASALDSNTNINVDNRFQVSLQDQRYSEVVTCAGSHQISANMTDEQHTKLVKAVQSFKLMPQTTHYISVGYADDNQVVLQEITAAEALTLLKDAPRQTHQISRVVRNCNTSPSDERTVSERTTTKNPAVVLKDNTPAQIPLQQTLQTPILLKVNFEFDSATIKPDTYPVIEDLAALMRNNPDITAVLEGHTDNKGAASYNLKLSQARADAVKTLLIQQYGIAANRLVTKGYGESKPIASNDTEQGRQNNRRVIVILN